MKKPVLILHLEDDPRDAELVRDKLQQQTTLACELRVARNRAEYEAALAQTHFDLILSDYRLPGYDGMAALALALTKQPGVPFILISGTLGEEQAVDCVLRGATDYLLKQRLDRLVPAVLRAMTEAEEQRKLRAAEEAMRASEVRYRRLFESAKDGILILDAETGLVVDVNPFLIELLGLTREIFLGKKVWELGFFKDAIANEDNFRELQQKGYGRYEDMALEGYDGKRHEVEFVSNVYLVDSRRVIQCNIRDITARKLLEKRTELTRDILAILNRPNNITNIIRDILALFKKETGIEAAGIRLKEGEDFPFAATNGFPDHFVELENHLCARDAAGQILRDAQGQPVVTCMCGNVVYCRTDATLPCFTAAGSFWTNSTTDLRAASTTRTLKLCHGEDYESVALIPLRSSGEIIGLLQLNDHRRNQFTLDRITFLEGVGASIGIAVSRLQAGDALREREEHYRMLFESAKDGIALADAESGTLVDCNHALCCMVERDQTELVGQSQSILHPPKKISDGLSTSFRQQQTGDAGQVLEDTLLSKSGKLVWVEVRAARVQMNGRDCLFGIFRDITQRKRAAESQARLITAVEQAAETIVITDTDAKILYVNPAFEKITGYTRAEAIGQNPRILKSGKHNAEFYEKMWAVLTAGQVWSDHLINRRKNGTLYEEDVTISPVFDAVGKVINYVAVKRDVTREVTLEEQNRQASKMEAVGRLAGGVAHDFNNKLQIIMGCAEMLLRDMPVDNPLCPDLLEIRNAAQRSADLTRQLLAFSRQQAIAPVILDVNATISGSLKMLGRLIGENIRLRFAQQPNLGRVFMDPSQLDQILVNLAVNARDAISGTGHIFIEATSRTLREADCRDKPDFVTPGNYVVLTFRDDGAGMTEAIREHIFEPFFTTKAVGKGTGLGLATIYGIIKQNQGAITVQSLPGQGTTFTIYLPCSEETTPETAEQPEQRMPTGTETILLVEDEESVLGLVRRTLMEQGYNVLTAVIPRLALRMCEQYRNSIHLLLTDVIIPDMDGRELSEHIQKLRPDIRILFMSGYPADILEHHGHLPAELHVLQKPFTAATLAQRVRAVLDAAPPSVT